MMEFVETSFGRLDILVSNAASGGFRPLLSATENQFHAAMNINALALLLLVQAGLPLLRASGGDARVIAISSQGAHRALPAYGLVGASKAALESLVRNLAVEAGPLGIRFNVVQAGLVETDSSRALLDVWRLSQPDGAVAEFPSATLQPAEVADAVVFLSSKMSSAMQGQTVVIGGETAMPLPSYIPSTELFVSKTS
jgi:enoyl-[acyl-carrier protein] reductase III